MGEFKTREDIYYYKGGTVDTIYNVDVSDLTLECFLDYLKLTGYGNDLKVYYKKPMTIGKEGYKFIWDHESVKELRLDAISLGHVSIYVDHCAEEKNKQVVEQEMDFLDDDDDETDDAYYKEDDSECSTDEELSSDDDKVLSQMLMMN
ncbi:hypothetical protein POM88_018620 [Heracleum sosnowskyi]|uniref:Uncharacterized protein n=1 Tax=Heracleum sosnowskyi TaxID=360622 RepID=A0AAD8IQW1_9APIA|nr:hypothetical protein POM88_018620 [Heracleum sosnowskyi]